MNKKRIVTIWLLISSLMLTNISLADNYLVPIKIITPSPSDLLMGDAITIAQEEYADAQGISEHEMKSYKIKTNFVALESNKYVWIITIFSDVTDSPVYASLQISSPDAQVISYEETDIGWFKSIRERWEQKKGNYKSWPVEEQVLFSILYMPSDDYATPSAGMLTKEEAAKVAIEAIPRSQVYDSFVYSFSYNSAATGTNEEYIWMIAMMIGGQAYYQANISAIDGAVIDIFELNRGLS